MECIYGRPYAGLSLEELAELFHQEMMRGAEAGTTTHLHLPIDASWALLGNLQLAIKHPLNHGAAQDFAQEILDAIRQQIVKPGSAMEEVYLRGNEEGANSSAAGAN